MTLQHRQRNVGASLQISPDVLGRDPRAVRLESGDLRRAAWLWKRRVPQLWIEFEEFRGAHLPQRPRDVGTQASEILFSFVASPAHLFTAPIRNRLFGVESQTDVFQLSVPHAVRKPTKHGDSIIEA